MRGRFDLTTQATAEQKLGTEAKQGGDKGEEEQEEEGKLRHREGGGSKQKTRPPTSQRE